MPYRTGRSGGSVFLGSHPRLRRQAVLPLALNELPGDGQPHQGADDILLRMAVVRAVMMAFLGRGVLSPRSSRMAGAVRATMASISAEPESDDVRLLLV
jgi:hypothetical protein